MSLSITDVIETLKKLGAPVPLLIKTETELEALVAGQKDASADGVPKVKNRTSVLLLDPENKLNGDPNLTAIVTHLPEGEDEGTVPERIYRAAYAQNAGGKRKKWNIRHLGEIGDIKRKYLKEQNVAVRSGKEPVRVLVVNGQIPAA